MQLKSLRIKNYKVLEDFEVKKLGKLNLIVGGNNSGKSTVLEAIRIYAGNANRALLASISAGHDEKFYVSEKELNDDRQLPFEPFFTGRKFPKEDSKVIVIGESENSSDAIKISHHFYSKIEESIKDEEGETEIRIRRKIVHKHDLEKSGDVPLFHSIIVTKNEKSFMFPLDELSRRRFPSSNIEGQESYPCSFLPTQFVSIDELADEWDRIALTDYADNIKIVLNFIEDGFEDIAFVKNETADGDQYPRSSRRSFNRIAKVKMSKMKEPIPLNSMGDGMLKALQLALKVFPARGGFLLIDEFENGLHYSVQEKIWSWLFELANTLNIQVFATTHSWDCVESFTKVALTKDYIDGVLFRVGRSVRTSDNNNVIATEFDREKLCNITQSDVEVR